MTVSDRASLRPTTELTFKARMRLVVLGLVAAGVVAALLIAAETGSPAIAPTLALATLACIASQRDAVYPDETALSGSVIVICACIVGLGSESLVAPAVCAAAAGLHRDHLRQRQFLKISVNLSALVVPALLATIAYRTFTTDLAAQILGVVVAVGLYWLLNNLIVGAAVGIAQAKGLSLVAALIRSDMVMLVFGLAGGLCGVVMVEVGVWVGMATLVALLIALDVFVISVPGAIVDLRAASLTLATRGLSGGVAGTVGASVTRGISMSALGAIAGLTAGVLAGVAVVAVASTTRLFVKHRHVDIATVGGLLVVEVIVPAIAASTAVVTVIAGLDVGLLFASALVIAVSLSVAIHRRAVARSAPDVDEDAVMVAVVEAIMDGLPVRDH